MIKIKITENEISMRGHACRKVNGVDRACAAVSALTCNLINSLEVLTDVKIRAETDSGKTDIQWEELSESGRILIDSWLLGMVEINNEYNCIEFI